MTTQTPSEEKQDAPTRGGIPPRVIVLIAVLVVLGVVWSQGTFDRALVNVSLNAKECGRNAFGATFCGEELKAYRRRVVDPVEQQQQHLQKEEARQREEQQKYDDCVEVTPAADRAEYCPDPPDLTD